MLYVVAAVKTTVLEESGFRTASFLKTTKKYWQLYALPQLRVIKLTVSNSLGMKIKLHVVAASTTPQELA